MKRQKRGREQVPVQRQMPLKYRKPQNNNRTGKETGQINRPVAEEQDLPHGI